MSKPMIRIHDTITNEVIDREMTDEEYSEHLISLKKAEEEHLKIQELAAQKAALLERLGITQEEANLLLG